MLQSLKRGQIEETLMNLHLVILLTQGSYTIKQSLEMQIDFDDLI